jgi:hypothetical protein
MAELRAHPRPPAAPPSGAAIALPCASVGRKALAPACFLSVALSGVLLERPAAAGEIGEHRNFGLGFAVGTPTSIAAKYFVHPRGAVDLGVSFWDWRACPPEITCSTFGYLSVASDYLWQHNLVPGTGNLDWHIGVGARVSLYDEQYEERAFVSARVPVGLDLTFRTPAFLELFGELAPRLLVFPGLLFGVEAFGGLRFYF